MFICCAYIELDSFFLYNLLYQDIKGFEEIDDDDTTTTNSEEENNTNKSDTDEEIEAITPSSNTAIGPPIEWERN